MNTPVALGLAVYLSVVAVVAWRGRTRAPMEYLLAGRRLTTPAFVATLVSTWYGGVLGVGEFSFRHGLSNWVVFGVPYYLAALLFALVLAARARRTRALSIPDQLRGAYGRAAGRTGTVLVLVMVIPAAYVLMLAELTGIYTGLPTAPAAVLMTAFLIATVVLGGFRNVVHANVLQFVLMFAAFAVVVPAALIQTGGIDGLWTALPASHRSWHGGLPAQYLLVWYLIAMQTLVEPTFFQRCYAAASPAVARRGILISIGFWLVFDVLTTVAGLAARVLLPDLDNPVLAYPSLGHAVLPPVANAFFAVGLFATVMSTAHSYLFLAGATVGHDLLPAFRPGADQRRWTAVGLVVAGGAAVVLALALQSVVQIWHHVGSIVTAALLFPLAVSHAAPRWRYRPGLAAHAMMAGAVTAASWIAAGHVYGAYPLNLEPVFPALLVSALFWIPRDRDHLMVSARPLQGGPHGNRRA